MKIIALEGPDGCGKSTQAKLLVEAMLQKIPDVDVYLTNQPNNAARRKEGITFLKEGKHIAAALVFALDRAIHDMEFTELEGMGVTHVVCDRHVLSSLAYQGEHLGMEWVKDINSKVRFPDVHLFLDLPVEDSVERERVRDGENIKDANKTHLLKVAYFQAMDVLPKTSRVKMIDATGAPETVHARIWRALSETSLKEFKR